MIVQRNLCGYCTALWPVFLTILAYIQQTISIRNEVRCGSIDIRSNPRKAFQPKHISKTWLKYQDCTLMEGDLTLSMIIQSNVTDDMFPVFENLREITGSILVYQVRGLLSLGRILPNLRVIGGQSLITNYALVIYQNYHLRDVGLSKLTSIKNGGVRIAENPRLCYVRSINWDIILRGEVRDLVIDQVTGCKSECDMKDNSNCFRDAANNNLPYCWNATHCQTACPYEKHSGSGCTDDGEPCHPFCMGGCSKAEDPGACHTCRDLDVYGICVNECPVGMYEQLGRRCLTKNECHDLHPEAARPGNDANWKTFENQCHYDCPKGFKEDPNDHHTCIPCTEYCSKICSGDTVDSLGSAMKFSKCNKIEGNLELDVGIGMASSTAEKFMEVFSDIEEITGYLRIQFSSSMKSLHVFKKLRVIHGQQLWKNIYALVISENRNLRQLFSFDNDRQMQIMRGKVYFQNNPMLCYTKIEAFLEHVGLKENATENDVSHYSNGDKAICDDIPLEVKVVQVYNNGFDLSWVPFNRPNTDHRKFLGYQIFYKKVDHEKADMIIDDDQSFCADTWNMHFVAEEHNALGGLISRGIEANTLYAVYVRTRFIKNPGVRNAISKIHFVRTTFGVPDPPERFGESVAVSSDTLKFSWDPPINPHGDITHYTITWKLMSESKPEADICSVEQTHLSHPDSRSSSGLSALDHSHNSEDKRPATKGCCDCSQVNSRVFNSNINLKNLEEQREESANFEDILQNKVFRKSAHQPTNTSSQPSKKKRRSLSSLLSLDIVDKVGPTFEKPPSTTTHVTNHNLRTFNVSADGSLDTSSNFTYGKINITGTNLVLTGLPHYSEYYIAIYACQDIRQIENYCSSKPLVTTIRTKAISEFDVVDPESVVLINEMDAKQNDKKLYWTAPQTPNGYTLGYYAKLICDDGSSPEHRWSTEQCINADDFEENKGVSFYALPNGRYTLEVRVVTSTKYNNSATTVKDIFNLNAPRFFTAKAPIIVAISIMTIVGVAICIVVRRMSGKKVDKEDEINFSKANEFSVEQDLRPSARAQLCNNNRHSLHECILRSEEVVCLDATAGRKSSGLVENTF